MKNKIRLSLRKLSVSDILFIVTLLLVVFSFFDSGNRTGIDTVASGVEKRMGRLERKLDRYASKVLEMPAGEWMRLGKIPDEFVIYKYVDDTLHSWVNHLPILNDEIVEGAAFGVQYNRLSRVQTLFSPLLTDVTEVPKYMNLGSQWYVMKRYSRGDVKLICGILVMGEGLPVVSDGNGVNPSLKLSDNYTIQPITSFDGAVVRSVDGTPLFSVCSDVSAAYGRTSAHSTLKWITLLFALVTVFVYYSRKRSFVTFSVLMGVIAISAFLSFMWAEGMRASTGIFSPVVYADSSFMGSLGILLLTNLYIFLVSISVFLLRKRLILWISKCGKTVRTVCACVCVILLAGLMAYIHISLKSVIFNSVIVLELFRLNELTWYSILVYLSYLFLFVAALFILQLLSPILRNRMRFTIFNTRFLIVYSLLVSLYLMLTVSIYGNIKEMNTAKVWTNKLAVERDLSTELLLRIVEDGIAQDRQIAALSIIPDGSRMIADRLAENYLTRLSTGYDITVSVCGEGDKILSGQKAVDCFSYFRRQLAMGTPLHGNSHFYFINDNSGRIRYLGVFLYSFDGVYPQKRLYVQIDSRMLKEQRGYSDLFPESVGGGFNIPPEYSYAKYISGSLVFFRGDYNFPVNLDGLNTSEYPDGFSRVYKGKYSLFVNKRSDRDFILVVRERRSVLPYLVAYSYLSLLSIPLMLSLLLWKPRRQNAPVKSNSFRAKIMALLLGTIIGTVALLSVCTVAFFVNRNVKSRSEQMSEKLQTVQAMLMDAFRNASSIEALMGSDVKMAMDNIASYTHTDINLYDLSGHLKRSTRNELYYVALTGSKIDPDAYYSIVFDKRKSFVNKETMAGRSYYSLYAPVLNSSGDLIAILNIPYFDQSDSIRREAISTSAAIINLFALMIIAVIAIGAAITTSLFRPLINLYQKMEKTDLFSSQEKIEYDNNDEISYIVNAYNRMIDNLADSTKRLAATEREQAWRDMARQIAHEIKNPLTPMRLNIQHLMRMKQNGVADLDDKLERICNSLLEQIDVLADTATEFSTFAKFNIEESVDVDVVAVLNEQIVLFGGYEGIDIELRVAGEMVGEQYHIFAPKSQITRVFVNLLTNSIQALEPNVLKLVGRGKIFVTLTKYTASEDSGFGIAGRRYVRIDVEDNGPGVSKENMGKLFTPRFTTKSSGSGLGLAICRSVLEQLGGTIKYSTSEELGGADFRVIIEEYVSD